jgi:hypothetical protein
LINPPRFGIAAGVVSRIRARLRRIARVEPSGSPVGLIAGPLTPARFVTIRGHPAESVTSFRSTPMPRKPRLSIPDAFHAVTAGDKAARTPTLVLHGEWLKAAGFPIGTQAYVTTDARGEIPLHRLGIRPPRKLRVRAAKP